MFSCWISSVIPPLSSIFHLFSCTHMASSVHKHLGFLNRAPRSGLNSRRYSFPTHSGSELKSPPVLHSPLTSLLLCLAHQLSHPAESHGVCFCLLFTLPSPPILVLVFSHLDVHEAFYSILHTSAKCPFKVLLSSLYTPPPNLQFLPSIFKQKFLCFTLNTFPLLTCSYTLSSPSINLLHSCQSDLLVVIYLSHICLPFSLCCISPISPFNYA